MAYAIGSAPRVSPPTASTDHPASRSELSPSGPMSASPSGLIVVRRASMYKDDCLPDASVNDPRRVDRAASNEMSAPWSDDDICPEHQCDSRMTSRPRAIK